MTMKPTSLPSVLLLAAIAAAVLLPISIEFAATLLMLAGFVAVGSQDYFRAAPAPMPCAAVTVFPAPLEKASVPAAA
jgi:hypothetical protein